MKKSDSANQSKAAAEQEKKKNINVDAAYLHVLGDLLMSVGVTIAATVIYFCPTDEYAWSKYVDPACTLLFSILVCLTCKKTLGSCVFILMEGAPETIKGQALKEDIEKVDDSVKVVDFHIWSLSRGKNLLSAQITCRGESMHVLQEATQVCKDYGIDQCTIQVEDLDALDGHAPCSQEY